MTPRAPAEIDSPTLIVGNFQWYNCRTTRKNTTGKNETYLIFLQNLATAKGSFPENLSEKINSINPKLIESQYVLKSIIDKFFKITYWFFSD